MDYSWLVIFIIISVISSILSKRKERQEADRRAREQAGQKPTGSPAAKPAPTAGPPPVAPGPFGPMWKPTPPKPAEPPKPPPPVLDEEEVDEDTLPPVVAPRPLFQEMRRELEERQTKEVARPAPVFTPVRTVAPVVGAPQKGFHESTVPVGDGVSMARRLVADTDRVATRGPAKRAFTLSSLRQAVVMSELIGKPLALRKHDDPWESA